MSVEPSRERGADVPPRGASIELTGVTKSFGPVKAVRDVNLMIEPGEFVTLLGPSGSGKTTTLNVISGFDRADGGHAQGGWQGPHRGADAQAWHGHGVPAVRALPAHDGARQRPVPAQAAEDGHARSRRRRPAMHSPPCISTTTAPASRASFPAASSSASRSPGPSSTSRARCSWTNRSAPWTRNSASPCSWRSSGCTRRSGSTFVFVTHDQEEALALSDRIAVFNNGAIEQIGTAEELYERPASLFVARFLGESSTFAGDCSTTGDVTTVTLDGEKVSAHGRLGNGERAAVIVRPERIVLRSAGEQVPTGWNTVPATVTEQVYLGMGRLLVLHRQVRGPGQRSRARRPVERARGGRRGARNVAGRGRRAAVGVTSTPRTSIPRAADGRRVRRRQRLSAAQPLA